MVEQVYRIEFLRDKVVALLRQHGKGMTRGAIAVKLELPLWAVDSGLEAAATGDLVEFVSPDGFWIKAHAAQVAGAVRQPTEGEAACIW